MSSQEEAIEAIQDKQNVVMIGAGGVGKSFVINKTKTNKTLLVAPTGIAALNIGAETAHSLFLLPFGLPETKDWTKVSNRLRQLVNSNQVDSIYFDEAFMLNCIHFDLIDSKLRYVKQNDLPFGGIPILVSGDPMQIEPILSSKEKRYLKRLGYRSQFIFDSKVWNKCNFKMIHLTKVYRQEDVKQIALLNSVRTKDKYHKVALKRLDEWCLKEWDDNILHLCAYNKDVERINNIHLKNNPNPLFKYKGHKIGKFKVKDCIVDEEVHLKVGTRIIMAANDRENGYLNGQQGIVTRLTPNEIWVKLDDDDYEKEVIPYKWESFSYSMLLGSITKTITGSFTQYPIKQANALSIHKSQSQTLDNYVIDIGSGGFAHGLIYVALSRCTDLTRVGIVNEITSDDIIINKDVRKFMESLKE